MALDGVFLSIIKEELEQTALGGRVDRISQPSREEIIFSLRCRNGNCKLLLSANANSPRDPLYRDWSGKSKDASHVLHAVAQTFKQR